MALVHRNERPKYVFLECKSVVKELLFRSLVKSNSESVPIKLLYRSRDSELSKSNKAFYLVGGHPPVSKMENQLLSSIGHLLVVDHKKYSVVCV